MSDILTPLTLDFLAWLEVAPRPYAEVMEAWRTSCPRLTIWEDAVDAGLVEHVSGRTALIGVTRKGAQMLKLHRGHRSPAGEPAPVSSGRSFRG